jgi:hypothetical protein
VTGEQGTDSVEAPLGRAEAIATELERRAAEFLSVLLVRAVEEAQDIWAEAQAVRRQQQSE